MADKTGAKPRQTLRSRVSTRTNARASTSDDVSIQDRTSVPTTVRSRARVLTHDIA